MNSGKVLTTTWLTCMLILLASGGAWAGKVPSSKKALEDTATHIVVGKVQAIYGKRQEKDGYEYRNFVAEVKIHKLEKGTGPKNLIYVRYYDVKWIGPGQMPTGESGHIDRPKSGKTYRIYLAQNAYAGGGSQEKEDGGYDVLYTNGFQPADK
jgi:hypothetical protein